MASLDALALIRYLQDVDPEVIRPDFGRFMMERPAQAIELLIARGVEPPDVQTFDQIKYQVAVEAEPKVHAVGDYIQQRTRFMPDGLDFGEIYLDGEDAANMPLEGMEPLEDYERRMNAPESKFPRADGEPLPPRAEKHSYYTDVEEPPQRMLPPVRWGQQEPPPMLAEGWTPEPLEPSQAPEMMRYPGEPVAAAEAEQAAVSPSMRADGRPGIRPAVAGPEGELRDADGARLPYVEGRELPPASSPVAPPARADGRSGFQPATLGPHVPLRDENGRQFNPPAPLAPSPSAVPAPSPLAAAAPSPSPLAAAPPTAVSALATTNDDIWADLAPHVFGATSSPQALQPAEGSTLGMENSKWSSLGDLLTGIQPPEPPNVQIPSAPARPTPSQAVNVGGLEELMKILFGGGAGTQKTLGSILGR